MTLTHLEMRELCEDEVNAVSGGIWAEVALAAAILGFVYIGAGISGAIGPAMHTLADPVIRALGGRCPTHG